MNIEKFDEKRDAISHDWIDFLQKLEILPIIIPNKLKEVELNSRNVNPVLYSLKFICFCVLKSS